MARILRRTNSAAAAFERTVHVEDFRFGAAVVDDDELVASVGGSRLDAVDALPEDPRGVATLIEQSVNDRNK